MTLCFSYSIKKLKHLSNSTSFLRKLLIALNVLMNCLYPRYPVAESQPLIPNNFGGTVVKPELSVCLWVMTQKKEIPGPLQPYICTSNPNKLFMHLALSVQCWFLFWNILCSCLDSFSVSWQAYMLLIWTVFSFCWQWWLSCLPFYFGHKASLYRNKQQFKVC